MTPEKGRGSDPQDRFFRRLRRKAVSNASFSSRRAKKEVRFSYDQRQPPSPSPPPPPPPLRTTTNRTLSSHASYGDEDNDPDPDYLKFLDDLGLGFFSSTDIVKVGDTDNNTVHDPEDNPNGGGLINLDVVPFMAEDEPMDEDLCYFIMDPASAELNMDSGTSIPMIENDTDTVVASMHNDDGSSMAGDDVEVNNDSRFVSHSPPRACSVNDWDGHPVSVDGDSPAASVDGNCLATSVQGDGPVTFDDVRDDTSIDTICADSRFAEEVVGSDSFSDNGLSDVGATCGGEYVGDMPSDNVDAAAKATDELNVPNAVPLNEDLAAGGADPEYSLFLANLIENGAYYTVNLSLGNGESVSCVYEEDAISDDQNDLTENHKTKWTSLKRNKRERETSPERGHSETPRDEVDITCHPTVPDGNMEGPSVARKFLYKKDKELCNDLTENHETRWTCLKRKKREVETSPERGRSETPKDEVDIRRHQTVPNGNVEGPSVARKFVHKKDRELCLGLKSEKLPPIGKQKETVVVARENSHRTEARATTRAEPNSRDTDIRNETHAGQAERDTNIRRKTQDAPEKAGCAENALTTVTVKEETECGSAKADECYDTFLRSLTQMGNHVVEYKPSVGGIVVYDPKISLDSSISSDSDVEIFEKDASTVHEIIDVDGETESPCQNPNSDFRVKLAALLTKPYNQEEHDDLLKEVYCKKQRTTERHLRFGRSLTVLTDGVGPSYVDRYKDFATKLEGLKSDIASNRPVRLNLLRGFFFYLQNLVHPGSFKPWSDELCLKVLPSCKVGDCNT